MSTMTIDRPAPAARISIAELRELVKEARWARRQRHINDATIALKQVSNPHKVADALGLPLGFVLGIAHRLGIDIDEQEDVETLRAPVGRWEHTVMQPAPISTRTRRDLAAAVSL